MTSRTPDTSAAAVASAAFDVSSSAAMVTLSSDCVVDSTSAAIDRAQRNQGPASDRVVLEMMSLMRLRQLKETRTTTLSSTSKSCGLV